MKDLEKFLQEKQEPGNWLEIATTFGIEGTNRQKSDKVRRMWNKYHNEFVNYEKYKDGIIGYTKGDACTQTPSSNDESISNIKFLEWKHNVLNRISMPKVLKPYKKGNIDNVLVIGDIHLPFVKQGYLKFCREQQERFNCATVVLIGDLLDNHAQSFHDSDADGLSAKEEFELAAIKLKDWYEVFPQATVLLGNHDRIIARKLFSVGISQRWLKPLGEVLNTPNWNYVEEYNYNGVLYVHGEGGTALKKAQQEMCSVVQGHLHSEGYVHLLNGGKNFAMQVGCGIDFSSYAFAYAQRGKKPILSCGVVLNNAPIIIPFND